MEGRRDGRERGEHDTDATREPIRPDLGTVLKSISRDRKRREGGLINRRRVVRRPRFRRRSRVGRP